MLNHLATRIHGEKVRNQIRSYDQGPKIFSGQDELYLSMEMLFEFIVFQRNKFTLIAPNVCGNTTGKYVWRCLFGAHVMDPVINRFPASNFLRSGRNDRHPQVPRIYFMQVIILDSRFSNLRIRLR